MHTNALDSFRPKSDSLADIQAALRATELEIDKLSARHQAMTVDEARLLVDGTDEEIERADVEKYRIEKMMQRLRSLLPLHKVALNKAKGAQERENLHVKHKILHDKMDAFFKWYRTKYPDLAEAIVSGLRMESEVMELLRAYREAFEHVTWNLGIRDGLPPFPVAPIDVIAGRAISGGNDVRIGDCVRLPSPEGLPAVYRHNPVAGSPTQAFWWATSRTERPDLTGHASRIRLSEKSAPSEHAMREVNVSTFDSGKLVNPRGRSD